VKDLADSLILQKIFQNLEFLLTGLSPGGLSNTLFHIQIFRAEIHQALLSQFSLVAEICLDNKDRRVLTGFSVAKTILIQK
jgi:hypothetical protein